MPPPPKPTLAVDSNVLFDLADGKRFAETAIEVLKEQGATILVTPTVLIELQYEIENPATAKKGKLAQRAKESLHTWEIERVQLEDVDLHIAMQFSKAIRNARLLPGEEINDGCILAETALGEAQYLLTSDTHLLGIDRDKLDALLREKDLPKVHPVSPRVFCAKLERRK